MKNFTKSLYLIALCAGGMITTNASYADVACTEKHCAFTNLTAEENKNPFVCTVTSGEKPTEVTFQNHSVLITGFNKDGQLKLTGDEIDMLSKYYFDAKKDKHNAGWVSATVRGGDITCKSGTEGRGEKWPGPYGK